MPKIVFMSAEISFHIHSTEDELKCLSAFAKALNIDQQLFTKSTLMGHYGNEVKRYVAHLTGQQADEWGKQIVTKLNREDRRRVAEEVEKYVDEHGKLYLRLDKQSLVDGLIRLGSADPVRVKLKPRFKWNTRRMAEEYVELLSGSGCC